MKLRISKPNVPVRLIRLLAGICLLFLLSLTNCDILENNKGGNSQSNGSCGPGSDSCRDSVYGEDSTLQKIKLWDDNQKSLWTLAIDTDGNINAGQTFYHHYNNKLLDTLLFWFADTGDWGQKKLEIPFKPDSNGAESLFVEGYVKRKYDTGGNKIKETFFKPNGMVEKEMVLDENGEWANVTCRPGLPEACLDSNRIVLYSDTLLFVKSWNPEKNQYLTFSRNVEEGHLPSNTSYLHIYNSDGKDSLVYWVESLDSEDTTFSGWNLDTYHPTGELQKRVFFESTGDGGVLFSWEVFDREGNLIEVMVDGVVDVFKPTGEILKSYYADGEAYGYPIRGISVKDTTTYVYDSLNRKIFVITRGENGNLKDSTWYKFHGDSEKTKETGSVDRNGKFLRTLRENGNTIREENYDSTFTLRTLKLKNFKGSDSLIQYYDSTGTLESEKKYEYWEGSSDRKKITHLNGSGDITEIHHFTDKGYYLKIEKPGEPDQPCDTSYRYSCKPPPEGT